MILYADTSALVKLLLHEKDSSVMQRLLPDLVVIATASIAYAELRAALAAAFRDGRVTRSRFGTSKSQLETLWASISPIAITDAVVSDAGTLAETHALRGYDAVHLAALRRLGASGAVDRFACWDGSLRSAAARLGYRLVPAE